MCNIYYEEQELHLHSRYITSRSNVIARTYPPCRYARIYTGAMHPRGEVNIRSRKKVLLADSIDLSWQRV